MGGDPGTGVSWRRGWRGWRGVGYDGVWVAERAGVGVGMGVGVGVGVGVGLAWRRSCVWDDPKITRTCIRGVHLAHVRVWGRVYGGCVCVWPAVLVCAQCGPPARIVQAPHTLPPARHSPHPLPPPASHPLPPARITSVAPPARHSCPPLHRAHTFVVPR